MSNYCINCGAKGTLTAKEDVFLEKGEWDQQAGTYEEEGNYTVLACSECNHEMIDLSA